MSISFCFFWRDKGAFSGPRFEPYDGEFKKNITNI